jgi:hypothetical protein
MNVPRFDRWRARLISQTNPGMIGSTDTLTFTNVAASVAFACPFFNEDGAPCSNLISYFFTSARRPPDADEDDESVGTAIGGCDAHLRAALDTMTCSMSGRFLEQPDEDAIDIGDSSPVMAAPPSNAELALASTLIERSMCDLVDFGSTEWDIRYPLTREARIAVIGEIAETVLSLTKGLRLNHRSFPDGAGIVFETTWDISDAKELIGPNRALRAVLEDNANGKRDRAAADYVALAREPIVAVPFEPRTYDLLQLLFEPKGQHVIMIEYWPTPTERAWRHSTDQPRVASLRVADLPRPGDVFESIARYRIVATHPIDGRPDVIWVSTVFESALLSPEDELQMLENSVRCKDCRIDFIEANEQYMVDNAVWRAAGYNGGDVACIACLEKRLGRELTPADFTDAPINYWPDDPAIRRRIDGKR